MIVLAFGSAERSTNRLRFQRQYIEAQELIRVFGMNRPLEKMAEVHRYVEPGSKQGNLVVTNSHDPR